MLANDTELDAILTICRLDNEIVFPVQAITFKVSNNVNPAVELTGIKVVLPMPTLPLVDVIKVVSVRVDAAETLDRIFTSMLLLPFVPSVVTPVMIPLRLPLNVDAEPDPAITRLERDAVTPNPIVAPSAPGFVVLIPII